MPIRLVTALALLALAAAPAAAGDGAVLVGSYWDGFSDFWTGAFRKQNGIVMLALSVGAVCLFIITRSKAKKS